MKNPHTALTEKASEHILRTSCNVAHRMTMYLGWVFYIKYKSITLYLGEILQGGDWPLSQSIVDCHPDCRSVFTTSICRTIITIKCVMNRDGMVFNT